MALAILVSCGTSTQGILLGFMLGHGILSYVGYPIPPLYDDGPMALAIRHQVGSTLKTLLKRQHPDLRESPFMLRRVRRDFAGHGHVDRHHQYHFAAQAVNFGVEISLAVGFNRRTIVVIIVLLGNALSLLGRIRVRMKIKGILARGHSIERTHLRFGKNFIRKTAVAIVFASCPFCGSIARIYLR